MGRIVAVVNQKGGGGKTTTAVNLAASLAVQKKKVLLVDLDPQGNAGSGFGGMPETREKTIYHVLIKKAQMGDVVRSTEIPGLDLIPSNIQLAGAEVELVSTMSRENHLKQAVSGLIKQYDYIFARH